MLSERFIIICSILLTKKSKNHANLIIIPLNQVVQLTHIRCSILHQIHHRLRKKEYVFILVIVNMYSSKEKFFCYIT